MKKQLQKVDELKEPPVVGRHYLVPHVLYKIPITERECYVPVYPNYHVDTDFGVKLPHFHFDLRFTLPANFRHIFTIKNGNRTNSAAFKIKDNPYLNTIVSTDLIYLKRKCMFDFSCVAPVNPLGNYPTNYSVFCDKFKDSNIKKTMKCPHHGFDLKQAPVIDGVVKCPLHGLCFDIKTGDNIPLTNENYRD